MTLADYLLARAVEEKHAAPDDPEVVARSETIGRIWVRYQGAVSFYDSHLDVSGEIRGLEFGLRAIALRYADRDDFREEWRL